MLKPKLKQKINGNSKPGSDYAAFISAKSQMGGNHGFEPLWIPDFLFDFQQHLTRWGIMKGRGAEFADCGLGKTAIQLVCAENIVRKTNKPVLILTPLSVSAQTAREADKFGIEAKVSRDGKIESKIIITNYERLHYFSPNDFAGAICDESSILKNFDGKTKDEITEFMRTLPYRFLFTATGAPNDYIELGTSSEALGELGYMDMLGRFFKNAQNSLHPSVYRHSGLGFKRVDRSAKFRFRGHAEEKFWRWVCSWARACRKPSDLGFKDDRFVLPELNIREHVIQARHKPEGFLFDLPAHTLHEQRDERRRTIQERCEKAAQLVNYTGKPAVVWCNLNDEGDLLEELIADAKQVSGSDSDEKKEEIFTGFTNGSVRVIVTKSMIAGFGMNWQHCAHQTFFPSHSFEQWYQAIRRSWRFGQTNPVTVDVITSEGEANILSNLQRKSQAAEVMFSRLVELMNHELNITQANPFTKKQKLPSWLS